MSVIDYGTNNRVAYANQERRAGLLSPVLLEALTELAATEGLPVAALIAILIDEALGYRLRRSRS